MREPSWVVVVPVKRLSSAKSRLRGALTGDSTNGASTHGDPTNGDPAHARLALAIALDTVGAVLACPPVGRVLVVTDDRVAGAALGALGARVVPDTPDAGLNPAVAYGAALATDHWVAALAADLPALRPADLAGALRAAADRPVRRYLPDAPGTGTVLLTAPPGRSLDPRFGVDSAARHAASGALPLTGAWPTLRRDVDTPADLATAAQFGLGPHTRALLTAPHIAAPHIAAPHFADRGEVTP